MCEKWQLSELRVRTNANTLTQYKRANEHQSLPLTFDCSRATLRTTQTQVMSDYQIHYQKYKQHNAKDQEPTNIHPPPPF